MRGTTLTALIVTILLGLAGLCQIGCEDNGSDLDGQYFRVEPSEVTLAKSDPVVTLSAAGGQGPYFWAVTDTTLGSVPTNGTRVTYTRTDKNGANTVVVTDSQGWTAEGLVYQQDVVAALTISPADVTLDQIGDQAAFTGSGGYYPYTWSVGNAGRGSLNKTTGSQVVYTRDASENNTVVLRDSKSHYAIADITQPLVPTLSINPGVATVSSNGGSQVFTAVGGTAQFNWTFVGPINGTRSPDVGQTTLYISTGSGQDILQVTDNNGTIAFATINKN